MYTDENRDKLDLIAQAMEIGLIASNAANDRTGVSHRLVGNREKMQISLVFSLPDCYKANVAGTSSMLKIGEQFRELKEQLATVGVSMVVKITQIEKLEIPG